jgi:hypothetical protein
MKSGFGRAIGPAFPNDGKACGAMRRFVKGGGEVLS